MQDAATPPRSPRLLETSGSLPEVVAGPVTATSPLLSARSSPPNFVAKGPPATSEKSAMPDDASDPALPFPSASSLSLQTTDRPLVSGGAAAAPLLQSSSRDSRADHGQSVQIVQRAPSLEAFLGEAPEPRPRGEDNALFASRPTTAGSDGSAETPMLWNLGSSPAPFRGGPVAVPPEKPPPAGPEKSPPQGELVSNDGPGGAVTAPRGEDPESGAMDGVAQGVAKLGSEADRWGKLRITQLRAASRGSSESAGSLGLWSPREPETPVDRWHRALAQVKAGQIAPASLTNGFLKLGGRRLGSQLSSQEPRWSAIPRPAPGLPSAVSQHLTPPQPYAPPPPVCLWKKSKRQKW